MMKRTRWVDKEPLLTLPRRGKGQPSAFANLKYEQQVRKFCDLIKVMKLTLDFPVSGRGWCYILEGKGIITKGEFDRATILINDCRKAGSLPCNICADDETRATEGIDNPDDQDPYKFASDWLDHLKNNVANDYQPYFFSDYQQMYVEVAVEKIDLVGVFKPICNLYHVPITNFKGWGDINSRINMMERFKYWEEKGKQSVLLYFGDFDPGGLQIGDMKMKHFRDLQKATGWNPENLIVDHFGLTYEFIEANHLTWIDNLETSSGKYSLDDTRHNDHYQPYVQNYIRNYGVRKCEANALISKIDIGRQLCKETIEKYIDSKGVRAYEEATREARMTLQRAINEMI